MSQITRKARSDYSAPKLKHVDNFELAFKRAKKEFKHLMKCCNSMFDEEDIGYITVSTACKNSTVGATEEEKKMHFCIAFHHWNTEFWRVQNYGMIIAENEDAKMCFKYIENLKECLECYQNTDFHIE